MVKRLNLCKKIATPFRFYICDVNKQTSFLFIRYLTGTMWNTAFLLLAASLSVSLARPRLQPLSSEMVNYINKVNTTWKVSFVCFIFVIISS